MPLKLIDSNVFLDVINRDPAWFEWSAEQIIAAATEQAAALNQIIMAEVAPGLEQARRFDANFPTAMIRRLDLPWAACPLAGAAHLNYRHRGGAKTSTLPDFFIGAHAEVEGHDVVTRDPQKCRSYFPSVKLITP